MYVTKPDKLGASDLRSILNILAAALKMEFGLYFGKFSVSVSCIHMKTAFAQWQESNYCFIFLF